MVYLCLNLPRETAPQKTEKDRAAGGGACVTGHTPYCYYHHHYYYVVIVIVLHAVIADGAQWGENDRRPPGLSAIGPLANVRGRVTMTEKQAAADVYAPRRGTMIIIITVVISMTFHPRCVCACVRRPWPVLRRTHVVIPESFTFGSAFACVHVGGLPPWRTPKVRLYFSCS